MTEDLQVPAGVDPTVASPARLYDYFLGGTHNFEVDRAAAERLRKVVPELSDMAWANRGFHQRAARWLAGQGIRQFIDVGSGLPTVGNTHEVVARRAPGARVVYVDMDPMVAAYADELIGDSAVTRVVIADLRDPASVLSHPDLRGLIDFDEPAALLMTAVLHFVADESDPWGLIREYMAALAPGSYLALSHGTSDNVPPRSVRSTLDMFEKSAEHGHARSLAEVRRLFEGLELVAPYVGGDPDVVHVGAWGAEDTSLADSDGSRWSYCGVARRP